MKYCCVSFQAHVEDNFFKKRTPDKYYETGWICRFVEINNIGKQTKNQWGWNIAPMSHCLFCGSKLNEKKIRGLFKLLIKKISKFLKWFSTPTLEVGE